MPPKPIYSTRDQRRRVATPLSRLNAQDRRFRREERGWLPLNPDVIPDGQNVEEEALNTVTKEQLDNEFSRILSARQRNAVKLYHEEGFTFEQIGQQLEVTTSRAQQLVKGAKDQVHKRLPYRLRKELEDIFGN